MLGIEDSIVSHKNTNQYSPSLAARSNFRRTSSIGQAPTKGEFKIMQNLGEKPYYEMKKNNQFRASQQLIRKNQPMIGP